VHPFDGEAWKHFNSVHPHFSVESRNMRLGLCTNGFNLFGSFAAPYSCWLVILTVYNLPPGMCMRPEFIFLSMVIPGLSNPGRNIDVCLRPLIDELTQLWFSRALTYDISRKQNFVMRAALMWTINDFSASGMVSGWSTHGKLACPYCIENNKAFTLTNKGKSSFFDCHHRFLPLNHKYRNNRNDFFVGKVEKDTSLCIFSAGTNICYLLVYVDDILLTGSNSLLLQRLIQLQSLEFKLCDLGPVYYFLGIEVQSTGMGLLLRQYKYTFDILT